MRALASNILEATRAAGASYASVLFGASPRVGLAILAATLVRPASGAAGFLAVLSANATARALGYRIDAVRAGYYGYNALLIGLAVLAGRAFDARTALLVVLVGAASACLTAVLGDLLHRGADLPVLALPFVLLGSLLPPALDSTAAAPAGAWLAGGPLVSLALPLPAPVDLVLRSLGAIFFQPSQAAGLAVLAASIVLSRIATVALLGGIAAGAGMASLLGAGGSPSLVLAATYNGALTSLAVGAFFFVPGRASAVAGFAAAALAAWLAVTLSTLLGAIGVPVLAWPFVLVAPVAIRALKLRAPDRPPFPSPLAGLSPEANLDYATALATRFGIPGPPRLVLPFAGTWIVTQSVGSGATHRGAWAHAFDFEMADERGFPFRGDGAAAEDYLCFGAPVLAPGAGAVAAVHDGAPDGRPGEQNTARPWGNAVVIQHAPDLFSVVAHLKRGSALVQPGQVVAAGEPVGACGSSGRSPRPHLHVQAQRTADLGAPAIPCRLVHYAVEEAGGARHYLHSGEPREGERVARPARSPIADSFSRLPPGLEIALAAGPGGQPARLRSEVALLGERYLMDLDRGDRLYFTLAHGDLAFTAHTGPAGTPLGALLLALPRLPSAAGPIVRYEDRPPAAALLPWPARLVHDALRAIANPIDTRAEIEMREVEGGGLSVRSRTGLAFRGRVWWRYRGRVEIGPEGLRAVDLAGERLPLAPPLRARRAA